MEISDRLSCVFSATIDEQDDSYVVTVPEQEIQLGDLQEGETYRIALLSSPSDDRTGTTEAHQHGDSSVPEPPVSEGEQRTVEIEDLGEQGDGLARVERGFVVIVPDTQQGERVTIELTEVRENVAFADVVERVSYFD